MSDDPAANLLDLCAETYYATGERERYDRRTRWVMDLRRYKQLRADCEAITGHQTDPDTWVPDPGDTMFGIAIEVRDDGGEPHLETPAAPQPPAWMELAIRLAGLPEP